METIRGIIYKMEEARQVTEKFRVQGFVVQENLVTKMGEYTSFYPVQASNRRIELLDGIREGQEVEVTVMVNGRKYNDRQTGQERFNVSLDLYKIIPLNHFSNQGKPIMQSDPVSYTPSIQPGGGIGLPKGSSLNGLGQKIEVKDELPDFLQPDETDLPF